MSDFTVTVVNANPIVTVSAPGPAGPAGSSGASPFVSVKSNGAVGDGVANDTTAIQTTINAIAAFGGGTVYLPHGTYKISSALITKSGVTLQGDGINATMIVQSSTAAHGITTADDTQFVRIFDILLDGPASGTGHGIYLTGSGSSGNTTFYPSLRNVMVREFGVDGIHIDDPVMGDFVNVTSKSNGRDGWFIYSGTSCTFVACYAHHNGSANGFYASSLAYSSLVSCGMDQNLNGYKIESCYVVGMLNCGHELNTGDGLQINTASQGIVVNGFWSSMATGSGSTVHVQGNSTGVVLTGLQENASNANTYFVSVDAGSVVSMNDCYGVKPNNLAAGTTTIRSNTELTLPNGTIGVGQSADPTVGVGITRTTDSPAMRIVNSLAGGNVNQASIDCYAANAQGLMFAARVSGDSTARFLLDTNGKFAWGSGAAARDTFLYRNGASTLKTDGALTVGGALSAVGAAMGSAKITGVADPTVATDAATKNYVDGKTWPESAVTNLVTDLAAKAPLAAPSFTGLSQFTASTDVTSVKVTNSLAGGNTNFPSLDVYHGASGGLTLAVRVTGDTTARFLLDATGKHAWGPGNASRDVNLYRSAAGILKTDNSLTVGTNLAVTGTATFTSGAAMNAQKVTGVADPTVSTDAATKNYVDVQAGIVANALAEALGCIAWTVDPETATFPATQANTHLGAVYFRAGTVVTSLCVPVTVAGAGLTMSVLGIYDANLNLVAQTANSPTAFQSTGWITVALTSTYTVPSSGLYYLGSGYLGTTLPTVLNIQHPTALSTTFPGGKPRGVHAAVPVGTALPNPATSVSSYQNYPTIIAL